MPDGFDVRVDPLSGASVIVDAARQARPNQPDGCPFCVGGLEAPEPYDVRWFPNRWSSIPDGRVEVVLYSPDHDATLWGLGVAGVRRVVELWADRTAALGARPDVDYVLVFENRGAEVGATIPHPHGQVYAYPFVPHVPRRELGLDPCPLCRPADPSLVVASVGAWTAWVPPAAAWPYELRIAPAPHVPDLPSVPETFDDLAAVLVDSLRRLDALFDEPMPLMSWWHQRPTDGGSWPGAHVHLHVTPALRAPRLLRYVAGAELGSGVFVNPVDPADAASRLRLL